MSGQKDEKYVELHMDDPQVASRLRRRLESPSIWDAFLDLLRKRGLKVGSDDGVRAVVAVYSFPKYADLMDLAEALLDYDKNFWLWRNHHMGMVERIIGRKVGTGVDVVKETLHRYSFDSSGVAYLKTTLRRRFFPSLWAARTRLSES
jgi:tryptophan 2,3-dioxygenase